MDSFNERVAFINNALLQRYGFLAAPGMAKAAHVLDLARSPATLDELQKMINWLPRNAAHAKAKAALQGVPTLEPYDSSKTPLSEAYKALGQKGQDAPTPSSVTGDLFEKQVAGYNPSRNDFTAVTSVPQQLQTLGAAAVIGLPLMGIGLGVAGYKSARQGSVVPLGKEVAKDYDAVKQGFADMITDPRHNSVQWALIFAGGVGLAERPLAALGAGSVRAAGRTLVRGVDPGTSLFHYGGDFTSKGKWIEGSSEEFPFQNAQNPVVRAAQAVIRNKRQAMADARYQRGEYVLPAADKFLGGSPFSWEAKFRREVERRNRQEEVFGMQGVKDIEAIAGWSESHANGLKKLPKNARKGLTVGENVALIIDSFGLKGSWSERIDAVRRMYQGQADLGLADPVAIEGVLASLKLADRDMANPREKFLIARDRIEQGSRLATEIKMRDTGLDQIAAYRREGAPAALIEGKILSHKEGMSERRVLRQNLKTGKGDPIKIQARIAEIERQLPDAPRHIGTLQTKLNNAILANKQTPASQAIITRLQKQLDDSIDAYRLQAQQAPPEAYYVPLVPGEKTRGLAKSFRGPRYLNGVPNYTARQQFPEVYHEFTGSAFRAGNIRLDTAHLTARNLGKAVRGSMLLDLYQTYLGMATKNKNSIPERYRVMIREPESNNWTDAEKRIFNRTDQGELTRQDVAFLSKTETEALYKRVFPSEADLTPGEEANIRYLDTRLLSERAKSQPVPTKIVKTLEAVNSPFRFMTLYGRPAYFANLAGSIGMGLIHEGPLLPVNMYKAFRGKHFYGEDNLRLFHSAVGAGRNISYIDETVNRAITRKTASAWNIITDRNIRTSALIHELKKMGLNDETITKLGNDVRHGDKEARATMLDAVDKANKKMVQFDNLTWTEREALRHVIFVYPWTRGSVIWSMKTALDRPLTTLAIADMGLEEYKQLDPFLKEVPGWFKRSGWIPLNWNDDGTPKQGINVSGLLPFGTVNSLLQGGPQDVLPPGMEFVAHALTGRDQYGNAFPHKDSWISYATNFVYAFEEAVAQLPQTRAIKPLRNALSFLPDWERYSKPPIPKSNVFQNIDITDPGTAGSAGSIESAYALAAHQAAFTPGYWGGVGQILGGAALTPREVNWDSLKGRYLRDDVTPVQKLDFGKQFALDTLKLQEEFLGRKAPEGVAGVLSLTFDIEKDLLKQNPQTPAEGVHDVLDYLHERMYLGDQEYARQKKILVNAEKRGLEPTWWTAQKSTLIELAKGNVGTYKQWDDDVKAGWALTKPGILDFRLDVLREDGLYKGSQIPKTAAERVDYAKKVAAFTEEYAQRTAAVDAIPDKTPEKQAAKDELAIWVDKQDHPIDGMPSPVRMDWAQEFDPELRWKKVLTTATSDWSSLDRFQKELLGVPTKGAAGWGVFQKTVDDFTAKQKPGERHAAGWLKDQAAAYIDREYAPGFLEDYKFSQKTLGERMQSFNIYREAPAAAKPLLKAIFADVNKTAHLLNAKNPDGTKKYVTTGLADQWDDYVNTSLRAEVLENAAVSKWFQVFAHKGDPDGTGLLHDLIK